MGCCLDSTDILKCLPRMLQVQLTVVSARQAKTLECYGSGLIEGYIPWSAVQNDISE